MIRKVILESGIPIDPSDDPRDVYTDDEWNSLGDIVGSEASEQPQLRVSGDLLDLAVNTYFDFVGRQQIPEDTWSMLDSFEQSFPKLGKVLRARLEGKI